MHSPRPAAIQIAQSDLHPRFLRFTGEALAGDDLHGPVLLADLIDFMVSCEQAPGGLERLLSRRGAVKVPRPDVLELLEQYSPDFAFLERDIVLYVSKARRAAQHGWVAVTDPYFVTGADIAEAIWQTHARRSVIHLADVADETRRWADFVRLHHVHIRVIEVEWDSTPARRWWSPLKWLAGRTPKKSS